MHNLGTVFRFEFIRTIKKPAFWISVLAFPLLFSALIAILIFSGRSAEKATADAAEERFTIAVTDESHLLAPAVLDEFNARKLQDKQEGITAVKNGTFDAFFYYPPHPSKQSIEVYGKDVGLIKNSRYEQVATSMLQQSVAASIGSPEKVSLLASSPQVLSVTYKDGAASAGLEKVIAPGFFLVLFYIVIVLLAGQMLASTTEEKENRVIEMILTTIKARTLVIGKILAIIALGALQIAVVATPAFIAFLFFGSSISIPTVPVDAIQLEPWPILVGALLFIGGFMLFTGILVAIGAAVPTAKEANNFFGVVILVMIIPFYAGGTIIADPSQVVVKVLSFFPLTSPITLMLRNAVGNATVAEMLIGLVIVFASGIIALFIAIRTFRYGTLEYSRRVSIREMFSRRA